MAQLGHVVNGKFVRDLGSFNVASLPTATETTSGLMTATDKTKLDKAYSSDDVATDSDIMSEIFNK